MDLAFHFRTSMLSTDRPHLQPFNLHDEPTHNEESKFLLFTKLPKELRVKIWQHALERNRMLQLILTTRAEIFEFRFNPDRNPFAVAKAGSIFKNDQERFQITVHGHQVLSKLLRVSREAREEALRFYRVHVPCTFTKGQEEAPGTLFFNPEFDFLNIKARLTVQDTLFDFLYRAKTKWDPRHIGIRNIAIDLYGTLDGEPYTLNSSKLEERMRSAVRQTLSGLSEVFFVSSLTSGRQILDNRSGLKYNGYLYNRSLPVQAKSPVFKRFKKDPRDIRADLSIAPIDKTIHKSVQRWNEMISMLAVQAPQIEYKVLLRHDPSGEEGPVITDRRTAEQWVQTDDDRWQAVVDDRKQDPEGLVSPVFGFWLFPLDALESPIVEESPLLYKLDLRRYTPELGCTELELGI